MSHIDKQATIDAIRQKAKEELADVNHYFLEGVQLAVDVVEGMPDAQPERKKGKWVSNDIDPEAWNFCSACGEQAIDLYDYCPNCGADMRGEQNG